MAKPQAPNWKKDAVISPEGWRHPKTGELLACRKFSQSEIDAFFEVQAPKAEKKPKRAPVKKDLSIKEVTVSPPPTPTPVPPAPKPAGPKPPSVS